MMRYPAIEPTILNIYGPISLNWYGLSYALGVFVCSYLSARALNNYFQKKIKYDDLMFYSIIGIVLSGRLFYVLFYNFSYYVHNLSEVLAIWQGGMSFHGGLLGLFISMILFSRKFKTPLAQICDVLVIYGPIGIFLGRIANFVNGELFGRAGNCYFCMIFPTDTLQIPRHPSQIYEALVEGLLLFIIMLFVNNKFKTYRRNWLNSGIFLVLYGVSRFMIENFRQPDEQIGFLFDLLTMGQLLCLVQFSIGLFVIYKSSKLKI